MPNFAVTVQSGSQVTSADSSNSLGSQKCTIRCETYVTIRTETEILTHTASDIMGRISDLHILQWIAVVLLVFGCSRSPEEDYWTEEVTFKPDWDVNLPTPVESDSVPHVFHLLWDQSIPIGGHVHRSDPDSQGALQDIHRLLKNARLTSDYGGGEASLKCLGITNSVQAIDCDTPLSRSFFAGGDSRLDQGVKYIVDGLTSGMFRGAALITDLITTTSYGNGATALVPALRDPTLRAYYKAGKIDAALIGVRMNYWGVHSGTCGTLSGPLGCWFHEERGYERLENVVKRPIYILIMGWRLREGGRKNNSIDDIATTLAESITDLEVKHETFSLDSTSKFKWSEDKDKYQPVKIDNNSYYCMADEITSLSGEFSDSTVIPISVDTIDDRGIIELSKGNSAKITLKLDCGDLLKKIRENDCTDLRSKPPKGRVKIENKEVDYWDDWSSLKHSSNLTLGLAGLIERGLYPDYYRTIIEPKLNLRDCKNG